MMVINSLVCVVKLKVLLNSVWDVYAIFRGCLDLQCFVTRWELC